MKPNHRIIQILGTLLLVAVLIIISTQTANAQLLDPVAAGLNWLSGHLLTFVTGVIAIAAWAVLSVAGWLLSAAGTLLNVGMYLTTHLGVFIDQSPVIYDVWVIIRDISSTLLIFFILFAAIQKILGIESTSYGELIKNIIIIGVLINFSFFFTRVLIDLSNIVSLEFYNAIAPANTAQDDATRKANITNISVLISGTNGKGGLLTSGGISNILMGALQVNSFWTVKGTKFTDLVGKNEVSANMNLIILQVAGIIVVAITIIDFLIIALVCVARIAILLFLLGFSPVWIAAMGMPKLNDLSKEWVNQFKIQLIFLPVYLAFLYVALRIVTASKLNTLINNPSSLANADNPWLNLISLTVGFGIIILLLNVPMIAAAKVAGGSNGFIDKAYKGLKSKAMGLAKGAGSFAGRRTLGRAAYALNESNYMKMRASSSPVIGGLMSKGLSSVSSSGFGVKKNSYENKLKDNKKEQEALHKRIGDVDRSKYSSDTEFKDAQKQARSYQAEYRSNLPGNSVIGFMLDNRANKQTASKLIEEDRKKSLVKQKSAIKSRVKETEEKMVELQKEIKAQENGTGFSPGKPASEEQKSRLKTLKDQLNADNKILDDIEETQEEDRIEKMAGKISDKNKPGDKDKDKPKEDKPK